jgi:hypothetical protein
VHRRLRARRGGAARRTPGSHALGLVHASRRALSGHRSRA